jgi:hypothetical protein
VSAVVVWNSLTLFRKFDIPAPSKSVSSVAVGIVILILFWAPEPTLSSSFGALGSFSCLRFVATGISAIIKLRTCTNLNRPKIEGKN